MLSWIHIQSIRDYKKTTQAVILFIVVVFLFSLAPDVFAQGDDVLGVQALEETNLALARTDFITIVARVINVILGLLGIIVVGYFIYLLHRRWQGLLFLQACSARGAQTGKD